MNFLRKFLMGLMVVFVLASVGCSVNNGDDDDDLAVSDDDDDSTPADDDDDNNDDDATTLGSLTGKVEVEEAALLKLSAMALVGVDGATVEVVQDGVVVAHTTTDSDGNWTIDDIPVGTYSIRAYKVVGSETLAITEKDIV